MCCRPRIVPCCALAERMVFLAAASCSDDMEDLDDDDDMDDDDDVS